MKPHRSQRVGELLRRELAHIVNSEMSQFARFIITVTAVRLSVDMHHARVWVSVYGDDSTRRSVLRALDNSSGYMRRLISHRTKLRQTPTLHFKLDETLDAAERIDRILRESVSGNVGNPSAGDSDD